MSRCSTTKNTDVRAEERELAPLFLPEVAKEFRSQWDAVQRRFVDDPDRLSGGEMSLLSRL